jgi:hypothetical protein
VHVRVCGVKEEFRAPTWEEANRKADDWWVVQRRVALMRRYSRSEASGDPDAVQAAINARRSAPLPTTLDD